MENQNPYIPIAMQIKIDKELKFFNELHEIFLIGSEVLNSAYLTRKEKLKHTNQILSKIAMRHYSYQHGGPDWNGRQWQWYNNIISKLKLLKVMK